MDVRRPLVLALAIALGFGCKGSGSASPVPYDRFCADYASTTCQAAQRCDCLEGIPVALCVTYMTDDCRSWVEEPVEAGRMTYDPAAAGDCLFAVGGILSDCSLGNDDWPVACDAFLVGAVAAGGYCESGSECVGGLECYEDACTLMPVEGQPCLAGYDCADDHFCGDDTLCHAERSAGQPCPEGGEACGDDLYCDSRSTTCQPWIGISGTCDHATWACDDDLYCSPSSGTCVPYPAAGQSCVDSSGECADDLYCDATGVCRHQLPSGSPCTEDDECLSWDCIDLVCEPDSDSICDFM